MEKKIESYNIRVYGILINAANQVLLSMEDRNGFNFTKFPGGGHHFGEGLMDCLRRELKEELGIHISNAKHFYTTDFMQRSGFDESQQLISVYYLVESPDMSKIVHGQHALDVEEGNLHRLYWKSLESMSEEDLTFPIDRKVLEQLKQGKI